MASDIIFEPINFRNLTVKNRVWRSSIGGRFDHYNGSGSQVRINWEEKFAKGGVGAIISAHTPVHITGRILPNYAMIDTDKNIPFWRKLVEKVHEYDCKFIMQLSHAGRQRDIPGIENFTHPSLSSTDKLDSMGGIPCRKMSREEIKQVVDWFAQGARRAREAGVDGIELHASHGYLITQFLSSGINDRSDEYGGSLENRARFLLEIIAAIRKEVGNDFHVQAKISAIDYNNYPFFWEKPGNTLEDTVQLSKWIEAAGIDAIHVSTGSLFPHPINPKGDWPFETAARVYNIMLPNGKNTLRNFLMFTVPPLRPIFKLMWNRIRQKVGNDTEGVNVDAAAVIKSQVKVPVLCTGGFQRASYIREVIEAGKCDVVTMARPLVANQNLLEFFKAGKDMPDKPCTFCNRCMFNILQNPLGCYDVSRYDGNYDVMVKEIMTVYDTLSPEFTATQ